MDVAPHIRSVTTPQLYGRNCNRERRAREPSLGIASPTSADVILHEKATIADIFTLVLDSRVIPFFIGRPKRPGGFALQFAS